MIVNVKGRNIEIDDELAKKLEEITFDKLDENLIWLYSGKDINNLNSNYITQMIIGDIEVNGGKLWLLLDITY